MDRGVGRLLPHLILAKQVGNIEFLTTDQTRELLEIKQQKWGFGDARTEHGLDTSELCANALFRDGGRRRACVAGGCPLTLPCATNRPRRPVSTSGRWSARSPPASWRSCRGTGKLKQRSVRSHRYCFSANVELRDEDLVDQVAAQHPVGSQQHDLAEPMEIGFQRSPSYRRSAGRRSPGPGSGGRHRSSSSRLSSVASGDRARWTTMPISGVSLAAGLRSRIEKSPSSKTKRVGRASSCANTPIGCLSRRFLRVGPGSAADRYRQPESSEGGRGGNPVGPRDSNRQSVFRDSLSIKTSSERLRHDVDHQDLAHPFFPDDRPHGICQPGLERGEPGSLNSSNEMDRHTRNTESRTAPR